MDYDITFCSTFFCELGEDCLRRGHIGKPHEPDRLLSFQDFSISELHVNDVKELVCDAKLTK